MIFLSSKQVYINFDDDITRILLFQPRACDPVNPVNLYANSTVT